MMYLKLSIGVIIVSMYTFFILKPFLSEIESLETEVFLLKQKNKQSIERTKSCVKTKDIGTKRFINFIDERIDEQHSEIVSRNQRETNTTFPSWSNAVLGLKGRYND